MRCAASLWEMYISRQWRPTRGRLDAGPELQQNIGATLLWWQSEASVHWVHCGFIVVGKENIDLNMMKTWRKFRTREAQCNALNVFKQGLQKIKNINMKLEIDFTAKKIWIVAKSLHRWKSEVAPDHWGSPLQVILAISSHSFRRISLVTSGALSFIWKKSMLGGFPSKEYD